MGNMDYNVFAGCKLVPKKRLSRILPPPALVIQKMGEFKTDAGSNTFLIYPRTVLSRVSICGGVSSSVKYRLSGRPDKVGRASCINGKVTGSSPV